MVKDNKKTPKITFLFQKGEQTGYTINGKAYYYKDMNKPKKLSDNPAAIEAAARVIEQYYYKANGKYSTLISRDKAKQILQAAEKAAGDKDV